MQLSGSQVLGELPVCNAVDVSELTQSTLHQESEHALVPGLSEDLSVWDTVTPHDTQDVWQAVECLEPFFFSPPPCLK